MFNLENSFLLVIDVQERLFNVMHEKQRLCESVSKLAGIAGALSLPVICTEQYPKGLGHTIEPVAGVLSETGCETFDKMSFSCMGEPGVKAQMEALGRKQAIICGIESHVCVYQTAVELIENGFEVAVVADGVASRTAESVELGLRRMEKEGVKISSVEMIAFELMRTAEHEAFREIARIIK